MEESLSGYATLPFAGSFDGLTAGGFWKLPRRTGLRKTVIGYTDFMKKHLRALKDWKETEQS